MNTSFWGISGFLLFNISIFAAKAPQSFRLVEMPCEEALEAPFPEKKIRNSLRKSKKISESPRLAKKWTSKDFEKIFEEIQATFTSLEEISEMGFMAQPQKKELSFENLNQLSKIAIDYQLDLPVLRKQFKKVLLTQYGDIFNTIRILKVSYSNGVDPVQFSRSLDSIMEVFALNRRNQMGFNPSLTFNRPTLDESVAIFNLLVLSKKNSTELYRAYEQIADNLKIDSVEDVLMILGYSIAEKIPTDTLVISMTNIQNKFIWQKSRVGFGSPKELLSLSLSQLLDLQVILDKNHFTLPELQEKFKKLAGLYKNEDLDFLIERLNPSPNGQRLEEIPRREYVSSFAQYLEVEDLSADEDAVP